MKHLGIIKKLAGAVAAALVLGSAVLGCSMFDSSDSSDYSDTNGGKARLLFSESGMRSLITPTAVQESDITKAELKAAPVNGEAETLKIWTSASEKNAVTLMKEEQNLFVDAGTYDFTLNLYVKLGNEEILCQRGVLTGKNVVSGDNRLDFETHYVLDGKGRLSISLTLDSAAGVDKIAYEIFALNDDLTLADTAAASGLVDGASFNASLATGYYSILLKLYNGENLLNTLDYTAKILAGCTSQSVLNITDVNTLHSLTFQIGNDVTWVNVPGEILKNSSAQITLPSATDISREGHRLLKWYTMNASYQKEHEYEPGQVITIEKNTTLYANWQQVFTVTFVNGAVTSTEVVDKDATVSVPEAPTKEGCLFLGWFNGDTKYVFTSPMTSNLTLTARWQRGLGTQESPYLLGTIEEWNDFANAVAEGTDYEGKYFKMDADIGTEETPVTTMAGTYDSSNPKPFKGIFDGDGHVLTVRYDGNNVTEHLCCATFRSVQNAVIKNLTVKGTLVNADYCAAGFIGYAFGTVSITDCVSEISLTPKEHLKNRNAEVSGFVGWNIGTLTVTNSVFKGSFLKNPSLSANVNNMGAFGFVGRNEMTANLTTCVFVPTTLTMGETWSAPFVYGGTTALTSCYYTTPFGYPQGIRMYENVADIPIGFYDTVHILNKDWYVVNAVAISGMSESYSHTGNTISVSYSVQNGDTPLTSGTDYTAQILKDGVAVANVKDLGTYTLEITANGSYHGVLRYTFYVLADLSGSGTETDPYIIASDLDWVNFANRVTNGTNYEGKFVKMTADIGSEATPVTVMAGTSNKSPFKGTFDGNGKILTVNYNTTQAGCCAPFYTSGTIKNLTVNGSIEAPGSAAGLAIICEEGNATIDTCIANVSLTSSAGGVFGIAGVWEYNCSCTLKNSVFGGKFIASSENELSSWAGLCTTGIMENCIFAPSEISGKFANNECGVFHVYRFGAPIVVTNCYYTKEFGYWEYYTSGENQCEGTLVYERTADYNGLCKKITVAGKDFYLPYKTTVEGLQDSYALNGGTVSPSFTVKVTTGNDTTETLSQSSDFLAKIKNESGVEVTGSITTAGTYTLNIIGIGSYHGTKTVSFTVTE